MDSPLERKQKGKNDEEGEEKEKNVFGVEVESSFIVSMDRKQEINRTFLSSNSGSHRDGPFFWPICSY